MAKAKTIKEGKLGKTDLRLVQQGSTYYGLADGKIISEGEDTEEVWAALQNDMGRANPSYFGFDGAILRYKQFFPDGFQDSRYLAKEREYKVAAREKLLAGAPMEDALDGSGYGDAVLSAFQATNLLSPFEIMRAKDAFQSPDADEIVRRLAQFAKAPSAESLARVRGCLKPYECAKWTVVTYLPFLWAPQDHMFLKPEVTKDYAARVGHPFAEQYAPSLSFSVYESLLNVAEKTEAAVSELNPQDRIDIQSFIWVVGAYVEGD